MAPFGAAGSLTYFTVESALGWVGVVESAAGVRRMTLPEPTREQALELLRRHLGPAPVEEPSHAVVEAIQRYLGGGSEGLDGLIDPDTGTAFQRAVWEATRRIPYGETRSYKWVAEEIGRPTAYRAVGQALGANPLALIVPCHRVIGSDGSLTGFGGSGLTMKQKLLQLEQADRASIRPA